MKNYVTHSYGSESIGAVVDKLAELYVADFVSEEIRSKAPDFYSADRFRDRMMNDYRHSPEFETVVVENLGTVCGFVTAANLIPNTRWWRVVTSGGPDDTDETGARTLAIFDLMVAADHRGVGLASLLHAALLAGRAEERVTLLSSAPQQPAFAMWQHMGYEIVGRARPDDSGPELDLFLRATHPKR